MKRAALLVVMVLVALCAVATLGTTACTPDPVHSQQVDDLGPEPDPNVHPGPEHRPGQPCVVCHGGRGPAGGQQFSVGGTVYRSPDDPTPVGGAIVHLVDANGATKDFQTNNAGNFYAFVSSWNPVYPVRVTINPGQDSEYQMRTHVGRDGSCAGCHKEQPGPDSPGRVWLQPPNDAGARGGHTTGKDGGA